MKSLTDIGIRNLTAPTSGQVITFDDLIPGFGVRISQGGTKTFVLIYGKKRRKVTLGRVGIVSLKDARQKAKDILADRQLNGDTEILTTFADAYARYMESYRAKNKASTVAETERLLTRHLKPSFDGKKLADITKGQVVEIIDAIPAMSERTHLYTAAKTYFRWCRRYGLPDILESVEKPFKSIARARLLTNDEFIRVWAACATMGHFGSLVRLLFLSGQRAGQIAALDGAWIDRKARTFTFPPKIMKSNREHVIPYGDFTEQTLDALPIAGLLFRSATGAPFNNWSVGKKSLDDVCTIPHWVLHDGRRFFSSTHASIGTPPHITERLLDHTQGSQSPVAAIYNRYSYEKEKREAIHAYEKHLASLLSWDTT